MQTRRDHVQAYQFAMGRLASSLVSGDPGRGDSPTRRSALGSVFGAGLVVLLCAGFGVYGLISPAAEDDWRKDGTVVLEQDTGTRYVYADGVLRPVRNYASALLIAGERTAPETVSAKSLAGVRHSTPVGIQGAPDTVPEASALATGAWSRCLPAHATAGKGQTLVFGGSAARTALPDDRLVLLGGPKGARYLLVRGVKYPVPGASALVALGLDDQAVLPATADWLAAVPTGAPLAAPVPAGSGKAAGKVAGQAARVGEVFRAGTGTAEHDYLMHADGLARVNATEYALLAARPGAPAPRQVGQADIAAVPVSAEHGTTGRVPDLSGVHALDGATVCLTELTGGRHRITVTAPGDGGVVLPPGGGALATSDGGRNQYLITEQGRKYRIADADAARALGFHDGEHRLTLPAGVLALVPDGPVLSRSAAAKG
ncbi:type VII secretion protein EccB [Streptomyces sp. LP11]|uniref:Type VII secretion protein EccB n=1 Tax=Streptomyces pyxinicus TaxID=2970331 RepID=A0ABT2B5G5_9ACTN|nr:type VII secretion protein EccB [Streptomyces sp. LP11]MCS0603754.1 type VII secretion protein EccB [Streptomyces sp. LP11]